MSSSIPNPAITLTCGQAASDNVFNAAFDDGINQEFLNLFLDNVETHIGTPASHWFCRTEAFSRGKNGLTKRYVTPFHEFDILNVEIAAGKTEEHQPIEGPSVVLVSRGGGKLSVDGQQGMDLIEGSILLLFAGKNVTFTAGKDGMQVYRCALPATLAFARRCFAYDVLICRCFAE